MEWRGVAFAASLIAVVGALLAGCGSDDEQPAAGGQAHDEAKVVQTFNDWQDDFIAGRGDEVCAGLSRSGLAEVSNLDALTPSLPPDASCADTIRTMIETANASGTTQRPAKALSARVNGARATAMVSDAGHRPRPMRLILEDGEWKMTTAGFAGLTQQD